MHFFRNSRPLTLTVFVIIESSESFRAGRPSRRGRANSGKLITLAVMNVGRIPIGRIKSL